MRDYDIIRPAVKLIEKKVKELVQQDQMAMFVSTGQRSGLTFAGDNKITKWFIENTSKSAQSCCAMGRMECSPRVLTKGTTRRR